MQHRRGARVFGEPLRPDLSVRATDLAEVMDDPACDPRALDRTFRRFAIVNPLVGGWRGVWRRFVRPVLPVERPARVLDLGCGGGDVARSIARWAHASGHRVEVVGIDPDPRAIRAAERTTTDGVVFRRASSEDLVAAGERFDVVVSNHVLHHLDDAARAAFLADSATLATRRVVHSDIRRSAAAYRAYALGVVPVAAGTFVRVDGLRSIRRSYTAGELRGVLPEGTPWHVVEAAPHRLLAVHDA
ncbi:methyltransferase domain-containing protein [Curtobacterium sp. MCBD17_028]|uniref:methyltransferase domain-containing protein n=1 Tax=Curtobacterium sp. MCBD17_028 TaxID=2175670 RepID=UPI0028161095|nr:methyltransferase domain-containing protein [Curtobacterium sp. MCBD17_028]